MSATLAIEDLLKPVPAPGRTTGFDHDAVHAKIREIRLKIAAEGGRHDAELRRVVDLASDAIQAHVKDLQFAVWLTDSLIQLHGFAGLRDGLTVVLRMVEEFWDELYPPLSDLEARAAKLQWLSNDPRVARDTCPLPSLRMAPLTESGLSWVDYAAAVSATNAPSEREASRLAKEAFDAAAAATSKQFLRDQATAIAESLEILNRLDAICESDTRFGKQAPSLSALQTTLERIENAVSILLARKLEQDPDAPPDAMAAPFLPGRTVVQPVAPADGVKVQIPGSRDEAFAQIAAAAHSLRHVAPSDPVSYLVLRALRWGELRAGGAELQTSLLHAPDPEVRTRLRALAAAGAWAELLNATEAAAATECGRGWLDIHRYAVEACEHLGYDAAAEAIRSELKALLAVYPTLASTTLPDDTGTANPVTAAWLEKLRESR